MSKFKVKGKELVVGDFSEKKVEVSGGVKLGKMVASVVNCRATQGKQKAIITPLAFQMAGCSPPGAVEKSCVGGGAIPASQGVARGNMLPLLTVGAKGTCIGVCMQHATPPFPRPQVCTLTVNESGQEGGQPSSGGGNAESEPTKDKDKEEDKADKKPEEEKKEVEGASLLLFGPRYESVQDVVDYQIGSGPAQRLENKSSLSVDLTEADESSAKGKESKKGDELPHLVSEHLLYFPSDALKKSKTIDVELTLLDSYRTKTQPIGARPLQMIPVLFELQEEFMDSWPQPFRFLGFRRVLQFFQAKQWDDEPIYAGSTQGHGLARFKERVKEGKKSHVAMHLMTSLKDQVSLLFPEEKTDSLVCPSREDATFYPSSNGGVFKTKKQSTLVAHTEFELVCEHTKNSQKLCLAPFQLPQGKRFFLEHKAHHFQLTKNTFVLRLSLQLGKDTPKPEYVLLRYWAGHEQRERRLAIKHCEEVSKPFAHLAIEVELSIGADVRILAYEELHCEITLLDDHKKRVSSKFSVIRAEELHYALIDKGTKSSASSEFYQYEMVWTTQPLWMLPAHAPAASLVPSSSTTEEGAEQSGEKSKGQRREESPSLPVGGEEAVDVVEKLLSAIDDIEDLKGSCFSLLFPNGSVLEIQRTQHASKRHTKVVISLLPKPLGLPQEQSFLERWGGTLLSCGIFTAEVAALGAATAATAGGAAAISGLAWSAITASALSCGLEMKKSLDPVWAQSVSESSSYSYLELALTLISMSGGVQGAIQYVKTERSMARIFGGLKDQSKNRLVRTLKKLEKAGERVDSFTELIVTGVKHKKIRTGVDINKIIDPKRRGMSGKLLQRSLPFVERHLLWKRREFVVGSVSMTKGASDIFRGVLPDDPRLALKKSVIEIWKNLSLLDGDGSETFRKFLIKNTTVDILQGEASGKE